jgi:hypothetical protein
VTRVVVVASSEVPEEALALVVSPEDDVHIVVPAVEQSLLQWLANDEDEARTSAREIGEAVGQAVPSQPSSVEVKPDVPSQLVVDAIAEHDPEKIVLALRDGERATWLEKGELEGLPDEIAGIPVEHIAL